MQDLSYSENLIRQAHQMVAIQPTEDHSQTFHGHRNWDGSAIKMPQAHVESTVLEMERHCADSFAGLSKQSMYGIKHVEGSLFSLLSRGSSASYVLGTLFHTYDQLC